MTPLRYSDPEVQEDLKRWQFKVVPDERTGNPRVKIGDTLYAPEEVSAHILRKVRMSAVAKTGAEVVKAVITVPGMNRCCPYMIQMDVPLSRGRATVAQPTSMITRSKPPAMRPSWQASTLCVS